VWRYSFFRKSGIFLRKSKNIKLREFFGMNGQTRKDIQAGVRVDIILKQDQRTGKLTRGIVKDILTNSPTHPRGIKVRLADGQIGRVQVIINTP
jgi:uncharacterized repeat protein (TIGR03833 family)